MSENICTIKIWIWSLAGKYQKICTFLLCLEYGPSKYGIHTRLAAKQNKPPHFPPRIIIYPWSSFLRSRGKRACLSKKKAPRPRQDKVDSCKENPDVRWTATGATCPPELIAQSKFGSEVPILPFPSVSATSRGCWNPRPHRPFAHDVASPLTRNNIILNIYFFVGALTNLLLSPLERSIGLSLRWAATSWGLPAITHSGRACRKRQHLFLVRLGSGFGDLCLSEWESHDSRLFWAVCIHRTTHTILHLSVLLRQLTSVQLSLNVVVWF